MMRTGEASPAGATGELPPAAAGSEVTRRLCREVYTRPAHTLRLVEAVLRDPARCVPSYGFDLVPVLLHALRARRIRLVRRLLLLVTAALLVLWAPAAAGLWVLALLLAAVLGPSGPGWALLPLAGCWLFAILSLARTDEYLHSLWLRGVQMPYVVAAAVAVVYVIDGQLVRAALKRQGPPSAGAVEGGRVRRVAEHQNGTVLPYDAAGRFIGAGREVRASAELRVPLRPAREDRGVVVLRETQLLESIRSVLDTAGNGGGVPGDPTHTEPLPGFSVTRVLALPADRWLELRRGARPEAGAGGLGRPERAYLRAQCVSFEGQLVVSLFVHAALQAGELRLTLRQQVMAPLVAVPEPAGFLARTGLGGALGMTRAVWGRVLKRPPQAPGGPGEESAAGPLSVRDALSQDHVTDLHQRSDAQRHAELMQSAVLRAVELLLDEHGFSTEAFSDRRAVINSIQVLGDNSGTIQLTGGLRVTRVEQRAEAVPPRPAEGVFMSPGFSRRDPSPEPPGTSRTGISITGGNYGTAQNVDGQKVSRVTQTGTGQGSPPVSAVELLAAFRADVERNERSLPDPEAVRDQVALVEGALAAPEGAGFVPALRSAARSLPQLIAGTAVQQTGEALVSAVRAQLP